MLVRLDHDRPKRASLLRLLQDLCSASKVLPQHLWLSEIHVEWRKQLGDGGEARVYLGQDNSLGRYGQVVVRVARLPEKRSSLRDCVEEALQVSISAPLRKPPTNERLLGSLCGVK